MTSQPKKRKRAKRHQTELRLKETRSKKTRFKRNWFIDHRLTEQRNAASRNLDRMTAMEIVRLMNREDRKVAIAVRRELPAIEIGRASCRERVEISVGAGGIEKKRRKE